MNDRQQVRIIDSAARDHGRLGEVNRTFPNRTFVEVLLYSVGKRAEITWLFEPEQFDVLAIQTGRLFDADKDVCEIAKDVREALKQSFAPGDGYKFSVTISRFSQGASIDVRTLACPFQVENPKYAKAVSENPHDNISAADFGGRWTTNAASLLAIVNQELDSRNQARGNWRAFYSSVDFDPE